MSLDNRPQDSEPLASIDQLVAYFRGGEKPPARHRVGMEHEKIGLATGTQAPLPFSGPHGIEAVLRRLTAFGYTPFLEHGLPIAATKSGFSISLEPGGQLELSGLPFHCCNDLALELSRHLALCRALGAELGQTWLGVGYRPFGTPATAQWMPKGRYARMRAHLARTGQYGLDMMTMTATVQANYDYADEGDAVRKIQAAQRLSPLVTALFANSPIRDGRKSGFLTFRSQVWREVDPARCGLRREFFADGFGYAAYAEWALDIPMIFLRRDGEYRDPGGLTFRQFMERGLGEARATLSDWEDHLTTLFPEIRLKRVIEVRGADVGNPGMCVALPALWKGLLYSADALGAAARLVPLDFDELEALSAEVARVGLAARSGSHSVRDLCRELLALASAGLRTQDHCGPDEGRYLDPLRAVVESGRTAADEALALLEGSLGGDVTRLFDFWRVA